MHQRHGLCGLALQDHAGVDCGRPAHIHVSKTLSRAVEAFKRNPRPVFLTGSVQNYAWGETGEKAYIPRLLGASSGEGKTYAELWIGSHPLKPAKVKLSHIDPSATDKGAEINLDDLIDQASSEILGPRTLRRFERQLPYLVKILSAAKPLSIQAHPNKRQALEGFKREEALGIPRDSEQRNYKDQNHKPEILIALTPFYALKGFRPPRQILEVCRKEPELRKMVSDLKGIH